MTQQENDNEKISNDNFMKTIYSKVSDLKTIFKENHQEMGFTRSSFSHGSKTKINEQTIIINQPKLQTTTHRIQLNNQSKINRQQHIILQRIKHLSSSKTNMAKTISSLSNFKLIQSVKPNMSHNNSNNKKVKGDNKWFIQTQTRRDALLKESSKVHSKSQLSHILLLEDRKQTKLSRIIGFLDKNSNHSQKQKKSLQKQNQMKVKETKEVTKNNRIQQGQQEVERQIDYQIGFKPMGSAKVSTRRLSTNNQQQRSKSQQRLVLNSAKLKTSQVKQTQHTNNKLSKTSKNSSDRKTYLAKGTRIRDILYKKLSINNPSPRNQQLVYVREYDQWVPAELAKSSKQQLESYLQILIGNKKQSNRLSSTKLTLNDVEIIYF